VHIHRDVGRLIGAIGILGALALAAPGLVRAYPTMPDGEPVHLADKPGRLPAVERSYSSIPPEAIDGVLEQTGIPSYPTPPSGTGSSGSRWSGVAPVVAVSILAALVALAGMHVVNRHLRRSGTARRIGG
jgi:hypothetical protein